MPLEPDSEDEEKMAEMDRIETFLAQAKTDTVLPNEVAGHQPNLANWRGLTEQDIEMNMVGKLDMSLYGTRDAAANWQDMVSKTMKQLGFRQGEYNPCTYYHEKRGLCTLVHGDDFVVVPSQTA